MAQLINVSDNACVSGGTMTILGEGSCEHMSRLGYAPSTMLRPGRTQAFKCGFNRHGDVIGSNVPVAYPGEFPKYYNVPITRNVDWSTHAQSQPKPAESSSVEIAEYFTVDNDEGYQKWSEKNCEERKEQAKKQKELKKVPEVIRTQPGHFMPSVLTTTNQTYGNYLDILPKYPAVYPLPTTLNPFPSHMDTKIEKSNISTQGPVTDHPFVFTHPSVVDTTRLTPHSVKARNILLARGTLTPPQTNRLIAKSAAEGQREKGFTFPVYTHTGLEINRSHLTGPCIQDRPTIYSMKVPGKIPHAMTLNRKQVCAPYVIKPRPVGINNNLPERRVVYKAIPIPGSM